MALSYTNIFMGHLERKILSKVDKKLEVWWRYIDDMFTILTHGEECFIELLIKSIVCLPKFNLSPNGRQDL